MPPCCHRLLAAVTEAAANYLHVLTAEREQLISLSLGEPLPLLYTGRHSVEPLSPPKLQLQPPLPLLLPVHA